jgi:hypothetical protein
VWWRHGVPAAVSVLLGTLVAILINLATAGPASISTLGGLGAAAAAWAGWEAWLAVRVARTGDRTR